MRTRRRFLKRAGASAPHDLAPERPELARELRALLHRHLEGVSTRMPTPNAAVAQAGA